MEEYPSFMTCILRIDITAEKWQRTVDKVLKHVEVTNFRMNTDGMVDISGTVYPNKFLKMLRKAKKKAELCHFQFGECSSNLFLPSRPPVDYGITNKYGGPNNMLIHSLIAQKQPQPGYFGGRDGRFLHYGDKPSQILKKKLKDSEKEKAHHHDRKHNHNHVHGRDHNHNHNRVHGRDHNHNHSHVHGRDHNHNHNHSHVHGHDHNHNHSHVHGRDHNHNHSHNHAHGHEHNHVQGHGVQYVEWEKPESKLEHAPGCINATTSRPKVQLDGEKQMKGRAESLKSQGINSCCLM